jgi:23S rRNA (cytosine1962-C5)-methyltransferase
MPSPRGYQTIVNDAPILQLRRHEERRLRAGHLWVYSNEVDTAVTPLAGLQSGALVRVQSSRGDFLGHAYANPHALICARILSRQPAERIDAELVARRLAHALALRERLYATPHYRLVHGEADGLPGLVLDRYGDVLVGQIGTAGMEALRPVLEAAIVSVLQPHTLIWRNSGAARELEGLPKEVTCAIGTMPDELQVIEAGLRYTVPFVSAQKTGWFYDQSANRQQLARLLPAGARVLDVCAYMGAWGISALQAGASEVVAVDESVAALVAAERNAALNGFKLATRAANAFDALAELQAEGARFEVIVLDPPAFIKRRKDAARGQAAYRKLNQLALQLLAPDALLVSCSCSYHLGADELLALMQVAACHTGAQLQLLAAGGQAPDHPVHPAIVETRYLKAMYCRVLR